MSTEIKKSRLGRGLEALIGGEDSASPPAGTRTDLPLTSIQINPFQPRKTFDDDDLSSLKESIRTHGVLQPVLVRQVGTNFQLIAGERRLRAAQAVGMNAIPVTIVDFNDQQSFEAALVENIQRTDLNPIEKAQGFKDYLGRYQMTHEQLATRLGLGRATITNLVSLLDLPANLQESVRVGTLTVGHAKILKGITNPEQQQAVAREIIARGLSVHATEAHLKALAGESKEPDKEIESSSGSERDGNEKTTHVLGIEEELKQKLGLKVEIKVKGKDRGQVILRFESNDDFERMLDVLRR